MLPQPIGVAIFLLATVQGVAPSVAEPVATDRGERLRREGVGLYDRGEMVSAAARFEACARESSRHSDRATEIKCLSNLGSAQFSAHQYSRALESYSKASSLARDLGDKKRQAAIAVNLSSLYLQNGDLPSAEASLQDALDCGDAALPFKPFLLAQRAVVALGRGNDEQAQLLMREAAAEADLRVDLRAILYTRLQLAWVDLHAGRLSQAEALFSDALRLSLLQLPEAARMSYRGLARLRLRQGRLREAEGLASAAIASYAKRPGADLPWTLFSERASVRSELGDLPGATVDYRMALELGARWRAGVLSGDTRNIAADVRLSETTKGFAQMLMSRSPRPSAAQAREAWLTTESSRALALRTARIQALLLSSSLEAGYGESLVRLRKLESLPATRELAQLRQRLAGLENGAGLSPEHDSPQSPERALADQLSTQKSLGTRHALISFLPGEPKSVVWAVTGSSFEWHFVPGRTELERLSREWVREFRSRTSSVDGAGRELSALLFGQLSTQVRGRERWVLSLDDFLFDVPLAALPDPFTQGLLLQSHSLNLIPSAYLLGERAPSRTSHLLVAVGDPVYNQADPRWSPAAAAGRRPWRTLPVLQAQAAGPAAAIELPRLVGSEKEVRAIEQVWAASGRPVRRRVGLDAPEAPRTFGGDPPEVLHFAVHVLRLGEASPAPSADYGFLRQPGDIGMAMGLGPDGEHRFLSPATIAGLPVRGSLVVLNGCSSGRAEALPGAGLFGLTRAWLAAGAGSVVATLWPAADDSGAFFEVFYRDYLRGLDSGRSSPATALRSAQLAALRSGTWRAHPRYWAAYFAMGKE